MKEPRYGWSLDDDFQWVFHQLCSVIEVSKFIYPSLFTSMTMATQSCMHTGDNVHNDDTVLCKIATQAPRQTLYKGYSLIDGFHGAWVHFRRARVGVCV